MEVKCRYVGASIHPDPSQEILQNLHRALQKMTAVQRERSFRQLFSQQQRLRLETR